MSDRYMQIAALQDFYPRVISNRAEVQALVARLHDEEITLENGMDHRNRRRIARILEVRQSSILLSHENIEVERQPVLMFSFTLDGETFSMGAVHAGGKRSSGEIEIEWPAHIHLAERRTRLRRAPTKSESVSLDIPSESETSVEGMVADRSKDGLCVVAKGVELLPTGSRLAVKYRTGAWAGQRDVGEVRGCRPDDRPGWRRIGLRLNPVAAQSSVSLERRSAIFPGGARKRGWHRLALSGQAVRLASRRAASRLGLNAVQSEKVEIVAFPNQQGNPMIGIVDSVGLGTGGVAVLIPPAWGRTKETLLPLARTLVQTFDYAGEPLAVLRYDGTQRRGESFVDADCRESGDETLHFTYTQAAQDLLSAARYLRTNPKFRVRRTLLVSFSLAAIEARIALAADRDHLIDGWVSVVGMTDVQSALKSVSGGIDFVLGREAGVEFGVQELGGVRIDIDHASKDVLESGIATMDEARRDMAKLSLPITWFHGRYDGWTDISRTRELLSAGDSRDRKLIEVPTGHQLRNSREAIETFQLISVEASRLLLDRELAPRTPDLVDLDQRGVEERSRVRMPAADLRQFWHDYLLGRDGSLGMQLLGGTQTYRSFMRDQVDALALGKDMRVLDLGAGTGEFACHLISCRDTPGGLRVAVADFVTDALRRARERLAGNHLVEIEYCCVDCEKRLPFLDSSFDRVLSSLVACYVSDPGAMLSEIHRVLKPGGVLVLSSPKRDADLSTVYRHTVSDLSPADVSSMVGFDGAISFDEIRRRYLNEGARLVDLEETGSFKFRDSEELVEMISQAGFKVSATRASLGVPPQTTVVRASKER